MSEKRRGLGRGLGALIPTAPELDRPMDVFFPQQSGSSAAEPALGVGPDSRLESTSLVRSVEPTGTGIAEARKGTRTSVPPISQSTGGVGRTRGTVRVQPVSRETTGLVEADQGDLIPVPGASFANLPVGSIAPNSRQPRTTFDESELAELVGSIKEIGVLQPIVVRPGKTVGSYELIMGERRWRATQAAGLAEIPAIIKDTEDGDLLRDALLENLHRSALNPLEEAAAYRQLLDDFDCTHEELAARIARSRPQISNTLRLLRLPPLVQRRVAAGVLSAGHARALLGLADGAEIERLAQRIAAEGLSVRATEEIVALGGPPEKKPVKRPRAGGRIQAIDELATRLSDRFETRVKVDLGKTKGKVTVEFASVEDLNRILGVMVPEEPGLFKQ